MSRFPVCTTLADNCIAMLNSRTLHQIATANEAIVERQFNKLKYSVRRLDRNARRARPDFLVSNRAGHPQMLCEVKTVHSAGYLPDRDAHVSMLDEKLYGTGVFSNPIDLTKITDNLADAVRKHNALAEDDPSSSDLPLLVAFFLTSLLTIWFVTRVLLTRR